jgi:hypothetical protein
MLMLLLPGPEKESKYVILGEKGKVQLVRDSRKSIEMTVTELQKNPINYTQVRFQLFHSFLICRLILWGVMFQTKI